MNVKIYNIFICHAWDYQSEHYNSLMAMFKGSPDFHYDNYSSPRNKPLIFPSSCPHRWLFLKQRIKQRIKHANAVLVIAGAYPKKFRDWVEMELAIAQNYNKPLIAICPPDQENIPEDIQVIATVVVRWDAPSIISAIRQAAPLT